MAMLMEYFFCDLAFDSVWVGNRRTAVVGNFQNCYVRFLLQRFHEWNDCDDKDKLTVLDHSNPWGLNLSPQGAFTTFAITGSPPLMIFPKIITTMSSGAQ